MLWGGGLVTGTAALRPDRSLLTSHSKQVKVSSESNESLCFCLPPAFPFNSFYFLQEYTNSHNGFGVTCNRNRYFISNAVLPKRKLETSQTIVTRDLLGHLITGQLIN